MATNTLLTPALITKETLVLLENNLVMAAKVNRQFENQFVKIGSTITVRKPNKFTVSNGPGLQIQNVTEPSTSITISNQQHVDFQFTGQDLTLVIEEFSERYLKPAASALANSIDLGVIQNFNQVFNLVGTAGSVPNSYAALAAVGQRMDEGAVPQDGRVMVLNPASYWALDAALISLFVRSVAEPALKGFVAAIANFEIYLDQNTLNQTWGAFAGTGRVNGANQTGSQIITNGWTASVTGLFNVGDVLTFAGVFAVNPKSLQSTNALQNFVVTAAASSDSGGNATISIYPSITTTGAYQTVTNSPANLALIAQASTPATGGTYAQNIGFVRDAFGLCTVPLELPDGVDFRAREMYKNISMTIIRAFDINNYVYPCRVDILWGTATFYPELACRLTA
jgi:hypothetical protein